MNTINGLPAHVLLVHGVVVFIPLTALLVILSAFWPAARKRIGVVGPLLALATVVLVWVATNAGKWLLARIFKQGDSETYAKVLHHTELGDDLLWPTIGLFVVAVLVWIVPRLTDRGLGGGALAAVPVRVVLGALAVAVGAFCVILVVRIGDSGAKAVWTGVVCTDPIGIGQNCTSTLGG